MSDDRLQVFFGYAAVSWAEVDGFEQESGKHEK